MERIMRRKEGFTLIELLAVIAILAILLLLVVPRVMEIYRGAKRNNFRNESLSIVTSAETKYMAQAITDGSPVICYEYKEGNNDLDGFMEYKEGYTGKIWVFDDNMYINLTDGEYIIKGITKKNVDKENQENGGWHFDDEFDIIDFSCDLDSLIDLSVSATAGLYDTLVTASAEEIDALSEESKNKVTYEFRLGEGEWTTAQADKAKIFTGLSPETSYTVQARVYFEGHLVGTSEPLTVNTANLLIPTITLASSAFTHNSVSLTATASDTQTLIKAGTYQFSKDNGATWTTAQNGNTYTFTGLSSGTAYNFKAKVQNNGGKTGISNTVSVTTKVDFGIASYTGSYTTNEDSVYKYARLLTSGTLTFKNSGIIDVFLVGGGGGGHSNSGGMGWCPGYAPTNCWSSASGGGAGGYTKTVTGYSVGTAGIGVTIGAGGTSGYGNGGTIINPGAGGTTVFGSQSVGGGGYLTLCNATTYSTGGSGGSCSYYGTVNGGSDGAYGTGTGNGPTTRAFANPSGELFAGGGGGCGYSHYNNNWTPTRSQGGAGGGTACNAGNAPANTGGGGGAGMCNYPQQNCAGNGGSGIVIVRWLK